MKKESRVNVEGMNHGQIGAAVAQAVHQILAEFGVPPKTVIIILENGGDGGS